MLQLRPGELGPLAHAQQPEAAAEPGGRQRRRRAVAHGEPGHGGVAVVEDHLHLRTRSVVGRVGQGLLRHPVAGELGQRADAGAERTGSGQHGQAHLAAGRRSVLDQGGDAGQGLRPHPRPVAGGVLLAQQPHQAAQVLEHRLALPAYLGYPFLGRCGVGVDLGPDGGRHHRDAREMVRGDVVQLPRHGGPLAGDGGGQQRVLLPGDRGCLALPGQPGLAPGGEDDREHEGEADGAEPLQQPATERGPGGLAGVQGARRDAAGDQHAGAQQGRPGAGGRLRQPQGEDRDQDRQGGQPRRVTQPAGGGHRHRRRGQQQHRPGRRTAQQQDGGLDQQRHGAQPPAGAAQRGERQLGGGVYGRERGGGGQPGEREGAAGSGDHQVDGAGADVRSHRPRPGDQEPPGIGSRLICLPHGEHHART
nr:hypothetical protein [Nocardioides houyundeii]